jgi:endonuclease/exonuclease/phosphatase family metal-dependent hydrolase
MEPNKIKILQWNIGGAIVRDKEDPLTYTNNNKYNFYKNDGLDQIIEVIKNASPDIIALQEVYTGQTQHIAETLCYKFISEFIYQESTHLGRDGKFGQSIISKYPINYSEREIFTNLKVELLDKNRTDWEYHDKGVLRCCININSIDIEVFNVHLIPFRFYIHDLLSTELQELRKDITNKLKPKKEHTIILGDFNFKYNQTFSETFPELENQGVKEIALKAPTDPKGRSFDRLATKGLNVTHIEILSKVLTDHYPIISTIELLTSNTTSTIVHQKSE